MAKTSRIPECHPDRPHCARGMCYSCYQTWWRIENPEKYANRPRRMAPCHPDKPVLAQDMCTTCYRRWWRKQNPGAEWDRSAVLQRERYQSRSVAERRAIMLGRYGLTEADYDRMLDQQDGKCAACGNGHHRRLQVDHCHETGNIRGLLCGNCNSALGHAKDDITRLQNLIRYLQQQNPAAVIAH